MSCATENSPDRLIFIMGIISEIFSSIILGSAGKSFGKSASDMAISTLSFTLRKASSGVTLKSNSAIIIEKSCDEVEVIFSIPDMVLISCSKGRVINFSISIAELPGWIVVMNIWGTTTSGNASRGIAL